ncbi:MAG: ribosomal protein S18-alanine N-acetyltransferase [Nitrospirales bacterium]|nr:ribosomal protein S18-alanine N-acetyltransferase [Nitrospira sp.]MDR4502961.1 ribosomal protein S18-alanine N-acetyltransferase [Nitrospirales bacterium]
MKFRFSQASLEDIEELVAIENRVFTSPWSRKSFEAELQGNEFSLILVARCEPDTTAASEMSSLTSACGIIGYICVWIVFEELRFMNIAVEIDWRRRGIGSALVQHALDAGKKQGAQRALLEVRESNTSAQALYVKFGFSTYGTRLNYYTNPNENAMLMARDS